MSERLELADEAGYASLAVNPSVVVIGAEIAEGDGWVGDEMEDDDEDRPFNRPT